jgi:tetraacyldisaccharide 4'-kinase
MHEPAFWWRERSTAAALLEPIAALYGVVSARRMTRPGHRASVPVVCVGNFTLGGTGKTPTAIALARYLMTAGSSPFFISRGYGGQLAGPLRVGRHSARDVGDEPLLLARVAPTIVARDRPAGAAAAAAAGADVLIMDDGLQSPSLEKDFSLALIDGQRGVGNARIFPAGPLRAPLMAQIDRLDALLVVGPQSRACDVAVETTHSRGLPVFHGQLRPDAAAVATLVGRPALAFAGIANSERFFATLDACGIPAAFKAAFPDHHRYRPTEVSALIARADREGLVLVTTEKDLARMQGEPAAAPLASRVRTLPVTMEFVAEENLCEIVAAKVQRSDQS